MFLRGVTFHGVGKSNDCEIRAIPELLKLLDILGGYMVLLSHGTTGGEGYLKRSLRSSLRT